MAVFVDTEKYAIYGGDAWSQTIELGSYAVEGDEDSFVAEDLSGWSDWSAMWRVSPSSTDSITLTVDSTGIADGLLIVSASEAQTRAMNGPGIFDVQAAAPNVRTFWRAKTSWTLDVTR